MLKIPQQLKDPMQQEIAVMFKDKPEALFFLGKYIEYIHSIDDCIDENRDSFVILKTAELAAVVFNTPYWKQWSSALYLVERLAFNSYHDSVRWENVTVDKDQINWMLRDSKVLNQAGYEILFAVILIEFGEDKLREFSPRFREYSHLNQGHDKLS